MAEEKVALNEFVEKLEGLAKECGIEAYFIAVGFDGKAEIRANGTLGFKIAVVETAVATVREIYAALLDKVP